MTEIKDKTGKVLHTVEIKKDTYLQNADLQGAYLRSADLQGANLQGADLRFANLQGADLKDANLRCANLQSANLYGADLLSADLLCTDLYDANLYDANLRKANLRKANLRNADLKDADLRCANLRGADLYNIQMNWDSHELIAERLMQEAGDDILKRMYAGCILISKDWCWTTFLKNAPKEALAWALPILRSWSTEQSPYPYKLKDTK